MQLHEFALLLAVLLPVVVVAGIDVYLAFHGETETLLLPRIRAFPSHPVIEQPAPVVSVAAPAGELDPQPLREAA